MAYNPAEEAINSLKKILGEYYHRPYEVRLEYPKHRSRQENVAEMLGDLVCDCKLLATLENVDWQEVEFYANRHWEADKHYVESIRQ